MNSSVSDSGSVEGPSPPVVVKRTRLIDINEWITCYLCGGYLIDAMTLIECQTLHSFCKSCIFKYLKEMEMNGMIPVCPTCDEPLNESKPHLSMRQDTKLQDIVYKLVPGLYKREMERRKEFYNKLGSLDPRGDGARNHSFYVPHDKISLSLEYHLPSSTDTDSSSSPFSSPFSHNNIHGTNKRKVDTSDIKSENGIKSNNCIKSENGIELSPERRYLSCEAGMPVYLLKKFIVQKYSLDRSYQVHLMYNNHSLTDDLTLMDVIYIYSWCRNDPMRFYYTIEKSNKRFKSASVESPVTIRCEESAEEGSKLLLEEKMEEEEEKEEEGRECSLEKMKVSPLSTSCSSDCSVSSVVSPRSGKHHHKHHHKKSREKEKNSGREKEPKATFHAVPTSRGVTIKKDVVSPQTSPTMKVSSPTVKVPSPTVKVSSPTMKVSSPTVKVSSPTVKVSSPTVKVPRSALVHPTSSSPSVVSSVTSITSTTACDVSSTTTVTMATASFGSTNSLATNLTLSKPPPAKILTKVPFSKTPSSAKASMAKPSTKISLPKPPVSKPVTLPKPPVSKLKVPVTKPAITKPKEAPSVAVKKPKEAPSAAIKSPLIGSYPPIKYPTIRYPPTTTLSTPKNTCIKPSNVNSVPSSGKNGSSSFPIITPSTNRGGNFPSPFSPESPSLPPASSSLSPNSSSLPPTSSSLSSLKLLNGGILPSLKSSGVTQLLSDPRIQSKNSCTTVLSGTNNHPSISSSTIVTSSFPSPVTSSKPMNGMLPSPYLKTVDQPRFSSSPIQKSSSPTTMVNQGSVNLTVPSVSSALSLTIPSLPPTTSSLSALKAVSGVLPSPSSSDLKLSSSSSSSPPSCSLSSDLSKPRSNHSIRDIIGDSYPSKVSGSCPPFPSMSGSIRPFAYRTVAGGSPCHVPPLTSHIPCRPVATRLVSASRTLPHSPPSLPPSSFISSTCKNRPSLDQVLNRLKFLGSTNSTM